MRIATVCPYCAATLEDKGDARHGMRACWRCLRPIVVIEAAREPSVLELEGIGHEQLDEMRKAALNFRESIRE